MTFFKTVESEQRTQIPFITNTLNGLSQKQQTPNRNFLSYLMEEDVQLSPPCLDNNAPIKYFNRADVKSALHVKSSIVWDMCSDDVTGNYIISQEASYYLYPKLIAAGLKIMVFSEDTDMAVP